MYKTILKCSITFLLLLGFSIGVSAWDINSGISDCPGAVGDSNGQKQIPVSINTSASLSGTLNCASHGYYSGDWSTWISINTHYSCPDDRYASQIQYNGANTEYQVYCKYIDDIVPSIMDITNPNPGNMLADSSRTYSISISQNGGAPISSVTYKRENINNQGLSIDLIDSSFPWSFDWNMSNVDGPSNNFREINGSRQFTYRVLEICDEALNCWTGNQNYYHNVYANTTSINSSITSNELSSVIVADGSTKNVVLRLEDVYGNDIVPAPGIARTIDINIHADNDLRMDQYDNTGSDTALYVETNTTPIGVSSITQRDLNTRSSTDGNYTIPFYVYAPTNNTDSLVPGSANITSIRYDINRGTSIVTGDNPQDITISGGSTTIRAEPLYTTTLAGDIPNYGFIEGASQNLDIIVGKANSTITTSNSLRAEFGDISGTSTNIENSRYAFSINGVEISEGQNTWGDTTQLSSSLSTLNNRVTFLIQDGPVESETFSYLASIVKYNVGGKTIVYPNDIIGKNNYHGVAGVDNSYQEGVKIIGNTSSDGTQEITTNQLNDDIRIIGKLTKSTFRKDIDQKAYNVTRTVDAKTSGPTIISSFNMNALLWGSVKYQIGNTGSRGTALFGNSVLYFGDGNLVTIAGATNIEGQKTIVVENGDLYIAGNIENTDNDGILGIIVINGDILIDTTVTDIHAALYTNKSILSTTNGTNRLYGDTSASDLQNQLYIYGSLFSENTIGGSRKSTIECPYYINTGCDQTTAQGYDLNYLRRYYMYDTNADSIPDTPSGAQSRANGQSGTYEEFPVIIDYNPMIQQTPPPFFD